MLNSMRQMMKYDEGEIRTPIEQASTPFHNRIDMPIEELLSRIESLKQEGNGYFTLGRMQPANRCYTDAVDLVRTAANVNDQIHRLLGTLLSNRAACFLKMAEGMSPESAKNVLKNAVTDCEVALKSSWTGLIPTSIRAKLERRKQGAINGISCIASQMPAELETLTLSHQQEEEQSHQQQPQTVQRRRRRQRNGTRRQRQQRRRQQRNRNRHTAEVADEHSEDENQEEVNISNADSVSILLGKDVMESKLATFITRKEDPCPCCFERFQVELSDTFTAVNSCGHACCLPCLSDLRKKSNYQRSAVSFTCPICRFPIPDGILSQAAAPIISLTPPLQDRLASIPLQEDERTQVAHELLLRHDFVVADVLSALDLMITDRLQSSLGRSKDLTPSQKQVIYEEARRPVDVLRNEACDLRSCMNNFRDLESNEYKDMKVRLEELQSKLIPVATKHAEDMVWERMNTAGAMGVENDSGEIDFDFHALHADEAKTKFDEVVLPVLQALGRVNLVVGRGNHSEGGVAKLKPALRRYIDTHPKKRQMYHSLVEGNDGVIRVQWRNT